MSAPAAAPVPPSSSASLSDGGGLSAAEVAAFRRDGCLVLPHFFSAATLASLSAAAAELVAIEARQVGDGTRALLFCNLDGGYGALSAAAGGLRGARQVRAHGHAPRRRRP